MSFSINKLFLFIAITLINFSKLSVAQVPNFAWVKSSYNPAGGQEYAKKIASDSFGNSYILGETNSNCWFSGIEAVSSGLFVVKYGPAGDVIWVKSIKNSFKAGGIAVDAAGNCYVAGSFNDIIMNIGSYPIQNSNWFSYDMFLAKFTSDGNLAWCVSYGGGYDDFINDIAIGPNGDIYAFGEFNSPNIIFGNSSVANSNQSYDLLLIKFNPINGAVVWAKKAGGNYDDFGKSIAVDTSGNCYLTGKFLSTSLVGLNNSTGTYNIFVLKYNSIGNLIWAKSAGGTGNIGSGTETEFGADIAVDVNGNCYITGGFDSPIANFGNITLENYSGFSNIFVAKYNTNGNEKWAKKFANQNLNNEYGNTICVDGLGNPHFSGVFNSTSIEFGNTTISHNGNKDIFISKCDTNGAAIWATAIGGSDDEIPQGIIVNSWGNIMLCGSYKSQALAFGNETLTYPVQNDAFIAKLGQANMGFKKIVKVDEITISPNPFSNECMLLFDTEQKEQTIKIIDILGKEVKSIYFSGTKVLLEKGELNPGIYFLQKVDNHHQILNKKIIIQ